MPGQRGFTLLETLIILSIISILAVIAVPNYIQYEVRSKVSEGFTLADPVKVSMMEYFETNGTWPTSNTAASVQPPTSYKTDNVDSISIAGNTSGVTITITYSIPALGANNTIVLTPSSIASNRVVWSCKQGSVLNKYRPANCRI